ncbi:MAG: patatin-like phospholipase family protein [Moheibacter sp.]
MYFWGQIMIEMSLNSNKDIALVLSGGAARGLAHIGVIRELENRGFNIVSITGTSIGALIGGLYAMGRLDEFEDWIIKQRSYSFIKLLDISFRRNGIIKGERILQKLRKEIPGMNIEELPMPFCCVATDLYTQQSVVLDKGRIYDAIRASIAIPSVFTPVRRDGMLLVDGGVLDNIPVDFAIRTKPEDKILAVDVNARIPMEHPSKGLSNRNLSLFRLSNQVISLMTETLGNLKLKENPPDFTIRISRFSCELYEFYKAKDQIELGRKSAAEQLDHF